MPSNYFGNAEKTRIEAAAFSDGKTALDYIKSNAVCAVFVDNHLPDMNGKDIARYIRSLGGTFATIPVIALTGDSAGDYGYRSDELTNWLVKPVSEAQFIESLVSF